MHSLADLPNSVVSEEWAEKAYLMVEDGIEVHYERQGEGEREGEGERTQECTSLFEHQMEEGFELVDKKKKKKKGS